MKLLTVWICVEKERSGKTSVAFLTSFASDSSHACETKVLKVVSIESHTWLYANARMDRWPAGTHVWSENVLVGVDEDLKHAGVVNEGKERDAGSDLANDALNLGMHLLLRFV